MGKKKSKGEYNDFLDGEKLRDNTEIRATLQGFAARDTSPPPTRQAGSASRKNSKGAKKPRLTHFLCLPLVTDTSRPQLQSGLDKFKEELSIDGQVPIKAVRPVGTLHLTLGVMSLSPLELQEAKQFLESFDLHVLLRDVTHRCIAKKAAEDGAISENLNAAAMPDTDALTIDLESLVPMQAPHKTSILYAEPQDASQRFGHFAQALREQFTNKGFLLEDSRPLRLHATILNTIYAKPDHGPKSNRKCKDGIRHVDHAILPHQRNGQYNNDEAASTGSVICNPSIETPTGGKGSTNEGHGPDAKSWMCFDARHLIDKYKGFAWAKNVRVDRLCICKMGAGKVLSPIGDVMDERYEVVAEKGIFE